jgi:hypothetical protein
MTRTKLERADPYRAVNGYTSNLTSNLGMDMELWLWGRPPIMVGGEGRASSMFLGLPGAWWGFEGHPIPAAT